MSDDDSSASTPRRQEGLRSGKDSPVPSEVEDIKAKDTATAHSSSAGARDGGNNTNAKRHSHSEGHRRRSSGDGNIVGDDTARGNTAEDNQRDLEGIFGDSSGDEEDSRGTINSSDDEAAGDNTAPPSPREHRRRRSSGSPNGSGTRRQSSDRLRGEEGLSPRRKVVSRERRRLSKRREEDHVSPRRGSRRHVGSAGPPALSQTQHAASSLAVMGARGSGSRRPRTRAELKEQGRMREWASFCRRKIYLSLEDLSKEEQPRVARKGAITPFSLRLMKVESWQVPSVLVKRASADGYGLRFSLSVSFYHAGSKRFYGDTFMGETLDEEDEERVEIVSEKRQGSSSGAKSGTRKKNRWPNKNNGRGKQGNGGRRRKGGRGDKDDDDDEEQEMEVGTKHEELVYWYTRFEDPNCIAVVELVATVMDTTNGIQVGQYGCGWTFIQFFGPNEPEAVQHRDVYRGSPRSLLFFEQGDWGSVGETVIPGCSLWFTLSTWENLMKARHLFRPDEIVSATDVLPGMQTKQIVIPDKAAKVGPFLGLRVEEESTVPSRRGRLSGGRGRWSLLPSRPRLAVCMEFRLSALRVIIPGREGYERDLLRSLGEDIPDQEIVKTTTHQHTLGFSSTQREVVTSVSGGAGGGKGEGRGGGGNRAKIVDRRAKIGFHNGHTLVLPHEWVETHLEETNEGDVLMLPEEVSSLNVDGYVAHPFFALVVLIEYTIRTRPKHTAGRGGGGRGKKGDPLRRAQAELSHPALPVVVGMQVFLPYDGKRLRLRNTPRDEESMDIGLRLAADKNVRLITTDLVYTNKDHLLDEAHGGASDGEDGRGPKMVFFDLKAYNSHGKMVEDETPASGDESPLEGGWEPPKETIVESSDGTTSSSIDSTSSESSKESSDTESDESDAKPAAKPKKTPPRHRRAAKPKPAKVKHKKPVRRESTSEGSSSESTNPSLVQGDSDASFLRQPKPIRKRHVHVQATGQGWDRWRKSVKVPRRRESLMGQTLQAPLHAEASAQTAVTSDREPDLGLYRPEAVAVGGFAPLAEGLSRASRTRLSRHGFTDVMKDTVDSYAETGVNTARPQQIPIDLDLEATDPLAKHEITLQFAAFRAPTGPGGSNGSREDGKRREGEEDGGMSLPTSLYFTYQFYTCLPTRTERMLLRPDGQRDRLYQAEGGGATCLNILVREGRYGRDEPSLGLRHSIDTTVMQPFEAQAFATYMAGSTLFVDVWDADALMHVGTLALPLRMLMRQQKGVVKTAMEYEVVASTAAAEDCGSGGGVAVKHGMVGKGPVVGMVQILASNYGEPGRGGDLPASGAVPGTVHPLLSGPNIRGDWRMASGSAGSVHGATKRGTRPRHKVRARPLSDTNPEISKYIEAVSGPSAGGGAFASLGRRGRGDVDADSMGYDELMLLVRRFRGSAKGTVWYSGALLKLLDVPGRKQLEQSLVRAVERAERSGLGMAEAFREMDQHGTGEISLHDLEEIFWGMLSPGEMARNHLKTVVKSIDPGETGKVGLRELVTFIHTRQGGGKGNAGKTAETGLRRAFARAELAGNSVEEAFFRVDERGKDCISHAEFWKAVRSLGDVPGMVKADLDSLLRRFDTAGDGRISLSALMHWAGRNFLPCTGVENAARKKILSAEAAALRQGQKVSIQEAFSTAGSLASALEVLGNVRLSAREMAVLRKRFEKDAGEGIDVPIALLFFGRDETQSTFPESADRPNNADSQKTGMDTENELQYKRRQAQEEDERSASDIERKLKSIVLKAESTGTSLAEVFGVFDKDGSGFITAEELEEGLRELRVFDTVPKDQVLSLVRKLKKNSGALAVDAASSSEKRVLEEGADDNPLVSAEEFVRFVGGEYEAAEAAQGRLRKVLTLAEEKDGVTLEAAFGALDKNGTGSISVADLEEGLRQLNVFDGMSKEQARLATRRFDHSGDDTVSLPEFLAFVGRPYAANDRPLETKLRRVLLKAESMGVSMEEAFQHFDKDGCGSITPQGFSTGLREMGVFQEFSEEEVEQVTSSFGADDDGAVSLPKFLRFLGKEYGKGGKRSGGGGTGRSMAQRLRLILKKAQELGTSLAASFEGFGADKNDRVSAQQLHLALKEIGQFRWTTIGEVKSFVRLLQDDAVATTVTPEGASPPESCATTKDMPPAREMFLTLPALEAFVEGGDAYLAKKERAALARQHSRDASSRDHNRLDRTEPSKGKQEGTPSRGESIRSRGLSRVNSWMAAGGSEPTGGGSVIGEGDDKEKPLLEQLRVVLARVPHGESKQASGGDGHGVRGHLGSFDVDSDGVLSVEEFIAALRSLGGRGGQFHGRSGVETLVSRFRDGRMSTAGTQSGVSIVKIAWWFDEISKAAHGAVVPMRGNNDKGGANGAHLADSRGSEDYERAVRKDNSTAGEALRKAVRLAEAKGTSLERTFARLDEDGDGFITLRQLLRGLDQLGVFEQASRDDVLDALDVLDADRRASRPPTDQEEDESKDGGGANSTGVDLVAFIRLMRQQPVPGSGTGEEKGNEDGASEMKMTKYEAPYEFSLDPDTKAAEKKLRRVVAKQARLGVDVEGVFRRYDPEQTGSVLRSDFVQAVMQLGIGLLESSASRHPNNFANSTGEANPIRRRQLGQLARAKGPVEQRLMRMRQSRRGLFDGRLGGGGERKGDEGNAATFEEGDESLALIQWYREGQKKSMVRHILASSLTTEYNLFFAFASPLFFEHPLRNPFNHEERFRIDLDDHQLRVVTGTTEWAYLRRNVPPCVGEIGDTPLESEFFDIDPQRGVQVTLMAHEVVFIPFALLSLEPRRPTPVTSTSPGRTRPSGRAGLLGDGSRGDNAAGEGGAGMAERSVAVSFLSASHGHVVSVVQVHLQRRPFAINRTFRFFQNEGEILKRSIQLLPGGESRPHLSKRMKASTRVGGVSRDPFGISGVGSAKYIHCVEEACPDRGDDDAGGGVVIEWARRAVVESEARGCADIQEVLVKCRVGQFPSQKSFYLLVYNDHFQGSLYETWHVIVQARLRMDVHSLLGQQSPADLVVRGDRYTRKVKAFSSAPAEVSFEPANAFQLVPGAYNRVGVRFRPLSIGSRKIHVHLVDTDSMEIVGAWLATATAMPPVVTKSYEVDLPRDRACHKRIAYANPWSSIRLFRLASSDPKILRPRYESLEVSGGGTGFIRLWFAALEGVSARKEAFLFINDSEGQNEECLLIRMRGV